MNLAQCVDEFYAAAFDPTRWGATLDNLAHAAGAEGATIVFDHSTEAKPGTIAGSASVAEQLSAYFFERDMPDPRQDRVRPSLADGMVTDFDHFTPEEIAAEPYYQEFLRPRGYGWHAVGLLREDVVTATLSLKRLLRQGPFEHREVDELSRLMPHLRRVGAAAAATHGDMMRGQLEALARSGIGAITLDRRGHRLATNRLVAFGDGLEIAGDELRASHRSDQEPLDAAVRQALAPERPSELPAIPLVPLRRPSGRRPLVVEVLPVIGQPGMSLLDVVAIALITDLARPAPDDIDGLRTIFGLTRREAEIAAGLANGEPLADVAERLGISHEHARQRLKSIFRKTDTNRQAELVSVIARLQALQRQPR